MGTTSCIDHIAERMEWFCLLLRNNKDFKDICVLLAFFRKRHIFDIQVEAIHFQKNKTNNT